MENIIGKKFKSNNCNEYIVLKESDKKYSYEIEFDSVNDVKFKTVAMRSNIIRGKVKNLYYPTILGIAYLGSVNVKENAIIYNRWKSMINRCYNPKDLQYKNYGGRGITVCERWKSFENFLEDFPSLDGFDENNLSNLQLDKDIKIPNNKTYAPDTCLLISQKDNMQERNDRNNKWFIAIDPNGKKYESNNQLDFARKNNLHNGRMSEVLNGKVKTKRHKGWTIEYKK